MTTGYEFTALADEFQSEAASINSPDGYSGAVVGFT